MELKGQKLLITGPTSQVALPIVEKLAPENQVFGLARFSKDSDRARVQAAGATPIKADMGRDDLSGIPDDIDYVLHFAVVKSGDFGYDLEANAEGVGRLIARCRKAKAFLHCSTAGVYQPAGQKPLVETDPLGDNHRAMMPTYSIAKIAAETVARFAARQWNVPTTIARFSVPYGDNGGWPWFHLMMMRSGTPIPVHAERPALYNLIHEDDYIAMLPGLLEIASVPATTINWGGSEATSIEEWCGYLAELTGLEPKFDVTENTIPSLALDPTRMHERLGATRVAWRDGIRRMVAARNPELLLAK
ncbi:MAG: NAD(P)-dependent oxidoreductase [Deltaproteobacteria bacterium]|nr:NAD(P)-dependent oxidoreductase [Deltaproteobacteria bacterium]